MQVGEPVCIHVTVSLEATITIVVTHVYANGHQKQSSMVYDSYIISYGSMTSGNRGFDDDSQLWTGS